MKKINRLSLDLFDATYEKSLESLGEWEALYTTDFNYTEFGTIRNTKGSNNFNRLS